MEPGLVNAKYIFLDIVNYSLDRPAEAQADIINTLNEIVKSALIDHGITDETVKLLPTGDGICIGFINIDSSRYDIHMQVSLSILNKLAEYNVEIDDPARKFAIRIGLNENVDNLIIDINGEENLSGAGITLSQRIMNVADAGNILLSTQVHEVLSKRESYYKNFRQLANVTVKHGKVTIYQYISEEFKYLNDETPSSLTPKRKLDPKMPEITATYIALLQRDLERIAFMLSKDGGEVSYYGLQVAYWYFAHDYLGKLHESIAHRYTPISPGSSDDDTIKIVENTAFRIRSEFATLISKNSLFSPWISQCTEYIEHLFVNEYGLEKIKGDWPELVDNILGYE